MRAPLARRPPALESLESRHLPASGVTASLLANGTLAIVGTPGNDTIVVRETNGTLSIDGLKFSASAAQVHRLWINAGAGNDLVDLRPTEGAGLKVPETILGGAGNDTLFGGAGGDYLDGGPGDNWLDAGSPGEHVVNGWNAYGWAGHGISYHDVAQGDTGTCSFCAALATAARRGVDLADRIHYLGNFTYRVDLFDPGAGAWTTRDVHFDGTMVRTSEGWVTDPVTTFEGKFWTVLYQRAYLELMGFNPMSGNQVANFPGDSPNNALAVVTGTPVRWAGTAVLEPAILRQLLLEGDGVTASIGNAVSSPLLVSDHTYMVDYVFVRGSAWYVRLYNPWGVDGPVQQGANDGFVTLDWGTFAANSDYSAWAER